MPMHSMRPYQKQCLTFSTLIEVVLLLMMVNKTANVSIILAWYETLFCILEFLFKADI